MSLVQLLNSYFIVATAIKFGTLAYQDDWKHAGAFLVASLLIYWHWYHFKNDLDMHLGHLFNGDYDGGANQTERRNIIAFFFAFHAVLLVIA